MSSYNTKIGTITIETENDYIVKVYFGNSCDNNTEETPVAQNAYVQICEYLDSKRKIFDLPLKFLGTEFQNSVWNTLLKIPYGQTRSYREIAKTIGNERSYRAVGLACNRNPICIIIPCHRVIRENGDLAGYAAGIDIKKTLLQMERQNDISKSPV